MNENTDIMGLRERAIRAYQEQVAANTAARIERENDDRRRALDDLKGQVHKTLSLTDFEVVWPKGDTPYALIEGLHLYYVEYKEYRNSHLRYSLPCPKCGRLAYTGFEVLDLADLGQLLAGYDMQYALDRHWSEGCEVAEAERQSQSRTMSAPPAAPAPAERLAAALLDLLQERGLVMQHTEDEPF